MTTPAPSSSLREFFKVIGKRVYAYAVEIGEPIAGPLFAINRPSALIRNLIFVAGFLLWMGVAYIANPPAFSEIQISVTLPPNADSTTQLIYSMIAQLQYLALAFLAMLKPFFAAQVFRRVLAISLAFWVAFRWAAIYLDDIFELGDVTVARGFIRQAAFASRYNRIVIVDGDIAPQHRNSPVYRIGGPGLVRVQLENAALFEKVDGSPHVVGPTRKFVQLEGFERLREVVDLRDQSLDSIEVSGRTKDGIRVSARDIRMLFSVHRDPDARQSGRNPLSFTDQAIKNLVYTRSNNLWTQNSSAEVQFELFRFISSHTLNEFLANTSSQDMDAINVKLQAVPAGGPPGEIPPSHQATAPMPAQVFKSRSQITEDVYTALTKRLEAFDLHWFGVGTWVTPDVIPQKHLRAWEQSTKNQADGSQQQLTRVRKNSRVKETLRLIQDVPINAFGVLINQGMPADQILRELMIAYREKIKNAHDHFKEIGEKPPIELIAALRHLQRL